MTIREKKTKDLTFFKSFYIAGFCYYEGALVFPRLHVGRKLRLQPEPQNVHDDSAVAVYLKSHKIGYIPRTDNKEIAALFRAGFQDFEAIVQQRSEEEHPAKQIRVGVFLRSYINT